MNPICIIARFCFCQSTALSLTFTPHTTPHNTIIVVYTSSPAAFHRYLYFKSSLHAVHIPKNSAYSHQNQVSWETAWRLQPAPTIIFPTREERAWVRVVIKPPVRHKSNGCSEHTGSHDTASRNVARVWAPLVIRFSAPFISTVRAARGSIKNDQRQSRVFFCHLKCSFFKIFCVAVVVQYC